MEDYTDALKIDKEESERYYNASLATKSEQQKRLEGLLHPLGLRPEKVADIACGGGGTAYHLAALFPNAHFTLVDMNEDAVSIARRSTAHLSATCLVGDIYKLVLETGSMDLVVCWQTLSWLDKPEAALRELIRICRPGGRIYASSLFNTRYDVDIYSMVTDHSRPSAAQGLNYSYNTYSVSSIEKWIHGSVSSVTVHEFEIPIDLKHDGRGLGTHTVTVEGGKRLQISAGMLLNWGILELRK